METFGVSSVNSGRYHRGGARGRGRGGYVRGRGNNYNNRGRYQYRRSNNNYNSNNNPKNVSQPFLNACLGFSMNTILITKYIVIYKLQLIDIK